MPTLNIMLNLFVPESFEPQLGHLTAFFARSSSYSLSESFSGVILPVFSSIDILLTTSRVELRIYAIAGALPQVSCWSGAARTSLADFEPPRGVPSEEWPLKHYG